MNYTPTAAGRVCGRVALAGATVAGELADDSDEHSWRLQNAAVALTRSLRSHAVSPSDAAALTDAFNTRDRKLADVIASGVCGLAPTTRIAGA